MAKSIVNKRTQPFGGGVKPSSNATFHDRVNTLCHPELVSGSHQLEMLNIVDFIKSLFVKRFSMTYLKKTIAFTLAETLVVMGIIGVVAALTIPNLNQSTGDREKVAKVKKVYANLEDAYGRATAVYGPYDEWFNDLSDWNAIEKRGAERILEFMKVSKNCGEDERGCFSSSIPTELDGTELEGSYDDYGYRVILADGASVRFDVVDDYLRIRADIDGPNKGKNQYGNDIFDFCLKTDQDAIPSNQLAPSYPYFDGNNFYEGKYYQGGYAGSYATAWIVRNGNMDYLKCPDELNWDTKTSCK